MLTRASRKASRLAALIRQRERRDCVLDWPFTSTARRLPAAIQRSTVSRETFRRRAGQTHLNS